MTRRIPVFATLVVALALATMIALGLWQLRRAVWKDGLLASYQTAAHAPPLYGIPAGAAPDAVAFRHTHVLCRIATAPVVLGGSDRAGRKGFRNIVGCTLLDGRLIMVDLGLSPLDQKPRLPAIGQRIEGRGVLIPDEVLARRVIGQDAAVTPLLLVLDDAVAGLTPSQPPAIETIPSNHRTYAVQWFLFALVALIIYVIALRRRARGR